MMVEQSWDQWHIHEMREPKPEEHGGRHELLVDLVAKSVSHESPCLAAGILGMRGEHV